MASRFVFASELPPLFDSDRASRTMDELAALAPDIVQQADFRSLLAAAAGNSPFLSRTMLRENGFLPELLTRGPEDVLAALNAEALAVHAAF